MTTSPGTARSSSRPHAASIEVWEIGEPEPRGFAAAWQAVLGRSTHAHFAMSLDYLRWVSSRGRRVRALLVEEGGRRGAMVQRRERRRWVSGWPWRWHALMDSADPDAPVGLSAADAEWLHRNVARYSGSEPVLHYLPHAPAHGVPGWLAGSTVVQSIQHSDEELFQGLEPSKRRQARRARNHDIEIGRARDAHEFVSFTLLHHASHRRMARRRTSSTSPPPPGEAWREWELPWMWLLLAKREGEVIAGVGDGVCPGGAMQGRTAAASLDARRSGATVLLGLEELRRGRDLGHRWFNYGGDTPFKREMSGRLGRRIRVFGWLDAGHSLKWWHYGEAALRQAKPVLARWRRKIGISRVLGFAVVNTLAGFVMLGADLLPGI